MGSGSTSKEFPGFDKIFLLGEAGSNRAFRGDLDVETDTFGLTRAEVHPTQPVRVGWGMGRARPVDSMMWATHAAIVIVADSVVQLLRSHGFTGWTTYEVAVRDKQGEPAPGYHGLAVTGRCGPIDPSLSVELPRIRPTGVFTIWKGLFFDPASWDGSDFFTSTQNMGSVFVVDAVKQAFERAKIRNVHFTALDQFERSWKF